MASLAELTEEWRVAVRELTESVDAVIALTKARGHTEPGVPLIVFESDTEMLAAIERQQKASTAAEAAAARVFAHPDMA